MQAASRVDRSQRIADLKALLRNVETAAEGSPDVDREFARIFPTVPRNVSRSIDALVRLIETELPGWWWTFGTARLAMMRPFIHLSLRGFDNSSPTPQWVSMVGQDPKQKGCLRSETGKLFDEGFHCDLIGGTVLLSMLTVFLRAKIALAKAARLQELH